MYLDVDDILPLIGEFGRFQKIMIAMITCIYFTMSYEILIIYFSTMIPSWQCVPASKVCTLNGTLPSDDRRRCNMSRNDWEYTESDHYSIATQFDIKCGEEWKLELTSAIFFLGWGIGSMFFGWMGDKYGRKITLFPSVAGIYLIAFVSQFMPHISLIIICRFMIGLLIPSAIVQPSILITEIVGTKYRAISGIVPQMAYPVGYCCLGLKAYLLRNWRVLSMVCTAPYFWVLGFYAFIPESVRFLQQQGRSEEAMAILHRIADWNKKSIPSDISIDTKAEKNNAKFTDLFRTRKMLNQTIILSCIWMSSAMSFYGLHLAANDLDGSIYTNFIYLGAIGFPGVVADIWICEKYGRRHAILIPLFSAGVCCLGVAFIPPHGSWKIARVVFGVLGKCVATASLEGLIVWTAEIYSTDIRSKGMGFVNTRVYVICDIMSRYVLILVSFFSTTYMKSMKGNLTIPSHPPPTPYMVNAEEDVAARIGATSSPFVAVGLKPFGAGIPFVVMGVPALIFSLLGLYLPETKDAKKMDSYEDTTTNTIICNEMADVKSIELVS